MGSIYVITAAIFVLGGAIAAVGDRVGSKAGKARLRLGKLRPRQTATLITVATGMLISVSTFGVVIATDASLREVIFNSERILRERRQAQEARDRAVEDLESVRGELTEAESEKAAIRQELDEAQATKTDIQQELDRLGEEFGQLQAQATELDTQARGLRSEIDKLMQERQGLLAERETLQGQIQSRDRELAARSEEIATQERELQASAARLDQLEVQRQDLRNEIQSQEEEIDRLNDARAELVRSVGILRDRFIALRGEFDALSDELDDLREGDVAFLSGQPIIAATVEGAGANSSPRRADEAVNGILAAAELVALEKLAPEDRPEQIIRITKREVEQLRAQLADGGSYLVFIVSAQNHVRGDSRVRAIPLVYSNREVFQRGEAVASVPIVGSQSLTRVELDRRIEKLFELTQSRVQEEGLFDTETRVGDENFALTNFVERLRQLELPIDSLETVARERTLLSGPLRVNLVARRQGRVVLSSDKLSSGGSDTRRIGGGGSGELIDN